MKKFEKHVSIWGPWVFGIVTAVIGVQFILKGISLKTLELLHIGMLLGCTGILCMCMFFICFLLTKIIEGKTQ